MCSVRGVALWAATARQRKRSPLAVGWAEKKELLRCERVWYPESPMQLPLELSSAEFQGILDSQVEGESIECLPHEYAGPLHFRNELVLEGRGATFWRLEGPVVVVEASGVTLRDVRIEVTADAPSMGGDKDCALIVKPGADVRLENVEVRGAVRGLKTEEGAWHYPYSLHIGTMQAGANYEFIVRIIVPVQCQISSQVSGIDVTPAILAPGKNEVRLKLSSLPKDSLVCGSLYLRTALLKRRIAISGRVLAATGDATDATAITGSMLWGPATWDSPQTEAQPTSVSRQQAPVVSPSQAAVTERQDSPQPGASSVPAAEAVTQEALPAESLRSPQVLSSTRIRKQSTPLSTVWSPPGKSKDDKAQHEVRTTLPSAFHQTTASPSAPPASEPPTLPQEGKRIQSSKSKPISIGIFGRQKSEEEEAKRDAEEVARKQASDQSPVAPDSGDAVPEPKTSGEAQEKSAAVPGSGKTKAKPAGPSVPGIFLKP